MEVGTHIILDAYNINHKFFIDIKNDQYNNFHNYILENLEKNDMNVLNYSIKNFENPPGDFTSLYLLSESHLSFHSCPELNFIAIDCFTCGSCDPNKIIDAIIEYLQPEYVDKRIIKRGCKRNISGENN